MQTLPVRIFKLITGDDIIGEIVYPANLNTSRDHYEAGARSKKYYDVCMPCLVTTTATRTKTLDKRTQISIQVHPQPFVNGAQVGDVVRFPASSILCWMPPPHPTFLESWYKTVGRPYIQPAKLSDIPRSQN